MRLIGRLIATLLLLLTAAAFFVVGAAATREHAQRKSLAPGGGRFVRAHDLDLFIQEAGPPAGHVVVLMHGTGAWSEIWRETMTRLAGRGHHAVAVDMPPFGFSERPANADYTTATQGKRLAALVATFKGPVTLVGHSFGARATVEAVMLSPNRIRSLVLVDAALGLHGADGSALPDTDPPPGITSRVLAFAPIRRPLVAGSVTNPLMTRYLLQQMISRKEAASPDVVAMLQRPLPLEGSTTAIGDWVQWFVRPDRPPASGRVESYRALRMPVSVIWGSTDSVTPLAQGKAIAALIPGARLKVLDNTGHIPAIESPAEFNAALLEFLGSLPTPGTPRRQP